MKTKKMVCAPIATLITIGSLIGVAHANLILDFNQVGGNITITSSGSVDITGAAWTHDNPSSSTQYFRYDGLTAFGNQEIENYNNSGYDLLPVAFTTNGATSNFTYTGDAFHVFAQSIGFAGKDNDLDPGQTIYAPNFTATFTGATYTSLGIDHHAQDQLIDLWGAVDTKSDTQLVQFRINSVPEPSSTLLIGLGGLGFMARRRRC